MILTPEPIPHPSSPILLVVPPVFPFLLVPSRGRIVVSPYLPRASCVVSSKLQRLLSMVRTKILFPFINF